VGWGRTIDLDFGCLYNVRTVLTMNVVCMYGLYVQFGCMYVFIISNLVTKIVVSEKRVRGRGLRGDGDGDGGK
jgi:hypothetical protein